MNRLQRMENLSAYIDGELAAEEVRLLFAWCESHPEDASEYEALAEVVRQVREVPEVEPPVDLQDRILRAVAANEPVTATREQALEWLDEYLDGELSEPRKQVVDHFLQTDPEFADLADLHVAMLTSLRALDEAQPPADLTSRIEAQIAAEGRRTAARPAPRPVRSAAPKQWVWAIAAAAVIVAALGLQAIKGRSGEPQVASNEPLVTPSTVEGTPDESGQMATGAETDIQTMEQPQPLADTPELPFDNSNEPVVEGAPQPDVQPSTVPGALRDPVKPRTDNVATNRRQPREEAPRARSGKPAPQPSTTRPKTETSKPAAVKPKSAPTARPANPAVGNLSGAIAEPSRGSSVQGPEFITGSGNDSVLGGDNLGTEGNLRRDNESPSRGQVDPTRRSEAPPF